MKPTTPPDLSIVIPAYREEKRIGDSLDALASFLKLDAYFQRKRVEVLVVAANAPDRTEDIVRSKLPMFLDAKLLQPGERVGKGRDVQYGMLRAKGNVVLFMDADLATPLHHVETFLKASLAGSDVVIGTRHLSTYKANKVKSWFASFGNKLYQIAGGVKVEDTQCGFKMFNRAAANICFSRLTLLGWGFDIEVLVIAQAHHLHIQPIRIDDWKDKPFSTYTLSTLRIITRSISDAMHVKLNEFRGSYR